MEYSPTMKKIAFAFVLLLFAALVASAQMPARFPSDISLQAATAGTPSTTTTTPTTTLRSATPAVGPTGFLHVVEQALALHIQESELAGTEAPSLVEDFPRDRNGKFDHQFLTVLFSVAGAQMGATDPAGNRRPTGISLRQDQPSLTRARYHQRTYGWWEETLVQFRCLPSA